MCFCLNNIVSISICLESQTLKEFVENQGRWSEDMFRKSPLEIEFRGEAFDGFAKLCTTMSRWDYRLEIKNSLSSIICCFLSYQWIYLHKKSLCGNFSTFGHSWWINYFVYTRWWPTLTTVNTHFSSHHINNIMQAFHCVF